MRRLLVLAPLLLTGCALLFPTTTSISMQHDGYELTCEDLGLDACIARGEALAAQTRSVTSAPIVSIAVFADRSTRVCTGGTNAAQCVARPG